MANEAIPVEGPYETHDFTVAEATDIAKGALLILSDPRTAATGTSGVFAGITATAFEGGKNKTELGLNTTGDYRIKDAGDGGSTGAIVVISGTNMVKDAVAGELLTGAVVGKRLQDASAGEVTEIAVGRVV